MNALISIDSTAFMSFRDLIVQSIILGSWTTLLHLNDQVEPVFPSIN